MGIFSTSTSASVLPSNPKPSSDGAFEAPNRDARAHCYQARDAFFECLERNSIVDSIREKETVEKVCGDPGKIFDRECAASWVVYFKQRRVMEHKKKQILEKLKEEGALQLPDGSIPPGIKGS